MSERAASKGPVAGGGLSLWLVLPLAIVLTLLFVVLLFPWQSVARRLAHELGAATGARVALEELAPAWTARGPVLRARNVVVEHPSVHVLRVSALELAPRFGMSWLSARPRLRVYAESDLGRVDGVLVLGAEPAFDGAVEQVAIERLPLRLSAAGISVAGELSADADVALDPGGTLRGRIEFDSPRLELQAALLPQPLSFTQAKGALAILETGATRIESVALEGPQLRGTLTGEIGLVHRSQPPPLDLKAELEIADPGLRALALAARLPLDANGKGALAIRGTAALPEFLPAPAAAAAPASAAAATAGVPAP